VAQPLFENGECFAVTYQILLDVGITAPKIRLEHTAASDSDFQSAIAEVIKHANFFNQPYRVVQWEDIDTGCQP
jgi:hypothetical protein